MTESAPQENALVEISSIKFLIFCVFVSALLLAFGSRLFITPGCIAAEVFVTVISLFVFGSIRYRLDKNALTYGVFMIIAATFWNLWWPASALRSEMTAEGSAAFWRFFRRYFTTLHGLDELIHADTMLFILGLTLFVSVIAQTRLLETASFAILKKNKGRIVPTFVILIAIVSFASGILDGVSMIGLMIRTMVIILFLAKAKDDAVLYAIMVSTVVTTVCGMWLAYGEPPNLIMKTNLHPHLDNAFFLRYCLPAAVGSYFIVIWNLRGKLRGQKIETDKLDVLDQYTADVRFLQASRHGEVLTPIEFVEDHKEIVGFRLHAVLEHLHKGEPLGRALVKEGVEESARKQLLGKFVSEDMAQILDEHYHHDHHGNREGLDAAGKKIKSSLESVSQKRIRAQWIGALAFVPFVGLLILHAFRHEFSLFWASFAGFGVAFLGIFSIPKMRKLALHEAKLEYREYLFLLPLFFSITLLQKSGFFNQVSSLLHAGIETLGKAHMAYIQFTGAAFLSALLDNNIVADFTSRALHGLDLGVLHLFSMAQIAGYAVGGCWTHIGCAQSVVAYAFIQREVNERFTPFQWTRAMTPVIVEIFILMTFIIYGESYLMAFLER